MHGSETSTVIMPPFVTQPYVSAIVRCPLTSPSCIVCHSDCGNLYAADVVVVTIPDILLIPAFRCSQRTQPCAQPCTPWLMNAEQLYASWPHRLQLVMPSMSQRCTAKAFRDPVQVHRPWISAPDKAMDYASLGDADSSRGLQHARLRETNVCRHRHTNMNACAY